jgi:hypothetical protein
MLKQLSMFGRALPLGGEELIDSSAEKAYDLLTSPSVDDPRILRLTKRLIGEIRPIRSKDLDYVSPSKGSSTECSRSKGGRNGVLLPVLLEAAERLGSGNARAAFRSARRKLVSNVLRNYALGKASETFISEIVAVREYGYKCRTVTKSPVAQQLVLDAYRKHYWHLLFRDICTAEALKREVDFIPVEPGTNKYIFSEDLSNATDTISRKLVDGVYAHLGIPPEFSNSWIKSKHRDVRPVTRGTFMGQPSSWLVLSLVHLAIARSVDHNGDFRIKGDDLIAYWTDAQHDQYILKMQSVGFMFNKSKCFKHKKRGIFCERYFYLKKDALYREPGTMSLRVLSKFLDNPYTMDSKISFAATLAWLGDSLLQLPRKPASAVLRAMAPSLYKDFKGIPLYAPIPLGGLGLRPIPQGYRYSRSVLSTIGGLRDGCQACRAYVFKNTLLQRGDGPKGPEWHATRFLKLGDLRFDDCVEDTHQSILADRYPIWNITYPSSETTSSKFVNRLRRRPKCQHLTDNVTEDTFLEFWYALRPTRESYAQFLENLVDDKSTVEFHLHEASMPVPEVPPVDAEHRATTTMPVRTRRIRFA